MKFIAMEFEVGLHSHELFFSVVQQLLLLEHSETAETNFSSIKNPGDFNMHISIRKKALPHT